MWDLPGPGIEPVSPALAGGFLTTVPPGKPPAASLKNPVLLFLLGVMLVECFTRTDSQFYQSVPIGLMPILPCMCIVHALLYRTIDMINSFKSFRHHYFRWSFEYVYIEMYKRLLLYK